MRAITKAESLEIIFIALSAPINFPVSADDPQFPGQPLPWKDMLENTAVTKEDLYKSAMTATKALNPGHYTGFLDQIDFNSHIDGNDSDTVSNFSNFLEGNLAIEET